MTEPDIALVLSPERWFDDLHRHCTDHGGARVRVVVVDPSFVLDEPYDVLVAGHRWPALTRALVEDLHTSGRAVLGVVDPAEPAAARHVTALGVDAMVDSDAPPAAIVTAIRALAPTLASVVRPIEVREAPESGPIIAVGGSHGSGVTEIALGLADAIAARGAPVALVDGDEAAPALAARLALPVEPNIRTAIDSVEHGLVDLPGTLTRLGRVTVLTGLPAPAAWPQIRVGEVMRVIRALTEQACCAVVNVASNLEDLPVDGRGRHAISRGVVAGATTIVAVGIASPVGTVRLLEWAAAARGLAPQANMHVVVNRTPMDPYRRGEVAAEIADALEPASVTFVPVDRRVESAAWAGTRVRPGPFRRMLGCLAQHVLPEEAR